MVVQPISRFHTTFCLDLCSTGVRPAPDISFRLIVETLWRYDVTFRLIILIYLESYNACVTADTSHHNEPSNPIINYMIAATSHTKKQTPNHWPNELPVILHSAQGVMNGTESFNINQPCICVCNGTKFIRYVPTVTHYPVTTPPHPTATHRIATPVVTTTSTVATCTPTGTPTLVESMATKYEYGLRG